MPRTTLPPPPVPQTLREMLKDYPEYIARLQEVLSKVVDKPSYGTPPFEVALWMIEGVLDEFIDKASEELAAAEANGDPEAIAKAKAKRRLMGRARANVGGLPDLWSYFETHKDAFE